jgi:predicted HicB family RNase H-like nuclease
MAISNPRRSNPKVIKTAIRVRVKPSVKAMAEQLAQKDGLSIADWLERLIAAEKARRSKKP